MYFQTLFFHTQVSTLHLDNSFLQPIIFTIIYLNNIYNVSIRKLHIKRDVKLIQPTHISHHVNLKSKQNFDKYVLSVVTGILYIVLESRNGLYVFTLHFYNLHYQALNT